MSEKQINVDYNYGGTSRITGLPDPVDGTDPVSLDWLNSHATEPEVIEFEQTTPTTQWVIVHNLGRIPVITVVVGNEEVEADITHSLDENTTFVGFGSAQLGKAVIV